MDKIIKIVLAILLLLCLADMPYGYYQIIRFAGLVGFGILAYNAYEKGHLIEGVIFAFLALLFQPLFKISLGRELWNILDVVVGVVLIVSVFIKPSVQPDSLSEEEILD